MTDAVDRSAGCARTLRFGIMCDGADMAAWQWDCLDRLRKVAGCVPVAVVVNAAPAKQIPLARRLRRSVVSGRLAWAVFDRLVVSRSTRVTQTSPPPDWMRELVQMECTVEKKGRHSEHFREEDIARLRALDLDFLIKFGFGIIRGDILGAARHGVWSFHHDDETRYRGAPPCFWEIYHGDSVTGAILQRLTERLDGGVVLKRGHFRTIRHSYVANRDQALANSTIWPAQVCRDILNGEANYLDSPPTSSSAPIYRYPGDLQIARFLFRVVRNWLGMQLEELLFCDMWNVGVVSQPIEAVARGGSLGKVRWLDAPGGDRYFADPSVLRVDGQAWILAEDYDYGGDHGLIAARPLDGTTSAAGWTSVLVARHHLSYPQLFEHHGEVYCLPEHSRSGGVVLFRAERFPDRWVEAATLLAGFAGIDPTLFFHDGRWWLFSTDLENGENSHLHVFYSDSLEGPYRPHANNPVKIDVRASRGAGPLFRLDGAWIRPTQNDSMTYGGSITLNRLVRLTPEAFEEETVRELVPEPHGDYSRGLHTIHGLDDMTVIDGKRRRIVPSVVVRKALAKLGKFVKLVTAHDRRKAGRA